MEQSLNDLAKAAQDGNKDALEGVMREVQGRIFNLAIRMLKSPADAEDATQEVLIKLVTHIGQFRGESNFMTWAYRIASTTILNIIRRDKHKPQLSFEDLSLRLEESLASYTETPEEVVEETSLSEAVRRSCTLGMLLCLDPDDRLVLVLHELLEFSTEDGAAIMSVKPTAYRQRLSRARRMLVGFVATECGWVNPDSPCRCHKHVSYAHPVQLPDPTLALFMQPHDALSQESLVRMHDSQNDSACRTMALLQAHPRYAASRDFANLIDQLFTLKDSDLDTY